MKFLAIEEEIGGKSSSDFTPHLAPEAEHVWGLQKKGIIREIYFDENHNAVLILECSDLEKAIAILDSLPLVKEGLIRFNIQTLYPYDGFERLFK